MRNERDDFWDISKLVPKKKNTMSPFVTKPVTHEHRIEGEKKDNSAERKLNFPTVSENFEKSTVKYEREASLIKSVTVERFAEKFDFYGSFRNAALIFYDMKAGKCEFEPFFSYMPQYSQLTAPQRSYYLYWREELRCGRYIKTDYSYVYLYVYEILNLPDKIPPEEGIIKLISIFREYRLKLPNITAQLCLWIQDYCLLYNLPVPFDAMGDLLFEAISNSELKEFYLSRLEYISEECAEALIGFLSYYDWRRGKYAGGESRALYKKHLLGAMRLLFCELSKNGSFVKAGGEAALLVRNSFRGALVTHIVKSRLEIEYFPIGKDESLRSCVTEALRYTENHLRALLGVKSRLSVKDLSEGYRKIIDFYFSALFADAKAKRQQELKPEYERLYESPEEELSISSANEIENISWISTERLIDDTETEHIEAEESSPELRKGEPASSACENEKGAEMSENADSALSYGLSAADISFISLLNSDNYKEAAELCRRSGELFESVTERINNAFLDNFGDVIIEMSDGCAEIIPDYKEDITEWITNLTK